MAILLKSLFGSDTKWFQNPSTNQAEWLKTETGCKPKIKAQSGPNPISGRIGWVSVWIAQLYLRPMFSIAIPFKLIFGASHLLTKLEKRYNFADEGPINFVFGTAVVENFEK